MPLNAKEADTLIDAIKSLVETKKKCDHKFLGSNNCSKCGDHISSIEGAKLPAGKALTLDKTHIVLDRPLLEGTDSVGDHVQPFADDKMERLYQAFKGRLIEEAAVDPVLLHLLTTRPEVSVEVERRQISLDGGSLKGRAARVVASGYLSQPRENADIRKEMMKTGGDVHSGNLAKAMRELQNDGIVVDHGEGWQLAPGVKITERTIESRG